MSPRVFAPVQHPLVWIGRGPQLIYHRVLLEDIVLLDLFLRLHWCKCAPFHHVYVTYDWPFVKTCRVPGLQTVQKVPTAWSTIITSFMLMCSFACLGFQVSCTLRSMVCIPMPPPKHQWLKSGLVEVIWRACPPSLWLGLFTISVISLYTVGMEWYSPGSKNC